METLPGQGFVQHLHFNKSKCTVKIYGFKYKSFLSPDRLGYKPVNFRFTILDRISELKVILKFFVVKIVHL